LTGKNTKIMFRPHIPFDSVAQKDNSAWGKSKAAISAFRKLVVVPCSRRVLSLSTLHI